MNTFITIGGCGPTHILFALFLIWLGWAVCSDTRTVSSLSPYHTVAPHRIFHVQPRSHTSYCCPPLGGHCCTIHRASCCCCCSCSFFFSHVCQCEALPLCLLPQHSLPSSPFARWLIMLWTVRVYSAKRCVNERCRGCTDLSAASDHTSTVPCWPYTACWTHTMLT